MSPLNARLLSFLCSFFGVLTVQAQSALAPIVQVQGVSSIDSLNTSLAVNPFSKRATGPIIRSDLKPANIMINCGCGPTKPEDQPVLVVDRSVVPYDSLRAIRPQLIESIEVYKGTKAFIQYGSKGARNGVIAVTTKKRL
ncbi:MAG: hypothetical protein EOO39_07525 [Cytophagaceae bacterium]|nr:MAG: hypothetical protein EOO39_07525 [Cytophagaceae bacterium]